MFARQVDIFKTGQPTDKHIHIQVCTPSCTHVYTPTCVYMYTCIHTYWHLRVCLRLSASGYSLQTYTTKTHTNTHIYTHKTTYVCGYTYMYVWFILKHTLKLNSNLLDNLKYSGGSKASFTSSLGVLQFTTTHFSNNAGSQFSPTIERK